LSKSKAKPVFAAVSFSEFCSKPANAENSMKPDRTANKILRVIIFEDFTAVITEAETFSPKSSTFLMTLWLAT
jgi:hypothetical protein